MTRSDDSRDYDSEVDAQRASLAALWEQARPAVFAYLTATVYDFHRAEDLLQEVAVAIAGQFHSYDPQRSFLAWAIGIARNRALLYFREQARDRRHFSDATLQLLSRAAESYPPEELGVKREALRHCLTKTTGRRRRVLELKYTAGLSIADIAARLDMSHSAVKIMLYRVRAVIEECIQRRISQEGSLR